MRRLARLFLVILVVIGVIAAGAFAVSLINYYKGPKSDHFDGTHFYNSWNPGGRTLGDLSKWIATRDRATWPEQVTNKSYPPPPPRVDGDQLRVTFIGHATVLIQTEGLNILTDPVWSDRASPFSWIGPKRVRKPGIAFDKLPKVDVIIISHNHYDALDIATLTKIYNRDKPDIFVGLGVDRQIKMFKDNLPTKALDWWQSVSINNKLTIEYVPVQHWSGRYVLDKNKTLWGGYLIKAPGGNIFFAGDTGYGQGYLFRELGQRFQPIRLALLPVGTYQPRWFMQYAHINPLEAVMIFKDLRAQYAVPIHYGTFQLSDEAIDLPLKDLAKVLAQNQITPRRFHPLDVGEGWLVPSISRYPNP